MPTFERITPAPAAWENALKAFGDRNVFQSREWLSFLSDSQNFEPVLAVLKEDDRVLGYFVGVLTRKMGFKILASPMPGSSTPYLGFCMLPGVSRRLAVEALPHFAFKVLKCAFVEVVDAHLTEDDVRGLDYLIKLNPTLEIDLTQTEDELLEKMTKSCRWTVRKGEKNGVTIEETSDLHFAEEFADQLKDVFAKQGLMPHYGADRVRSIIKHLHPTGNLLMIRARDPLGNCIGTAISPAANGTAYYLGGASWRQYQKLYPNEVIQWYLIRYWRRRGMRVYNMVGNKEFKQKFGGKETSALCISKSRNRVVAALRKHGPDMMRAALRVAWRIKSFGSKKQKNQTETHQKMSTPDQKADESALGASHDKGSQD